MRDYISSKLMHYCAAALVVLAVVLSSSGAAYASRGPGNTLARNHARVMRLPTRQQARNRFGVTASLTNTTPLGSGDLVWNGGPVEHAPVSYLIFWGPAWSNGSGGVTADAQIVEHYYADIGGTAFENILSQYGDSAGKVANTQVVGGIYVDPSTPPTDTTCGATTVEDSDLENEISQSITANNWPTDAVNATYYVFPANPYLVADPTGACSEQAFCAYHSWSPTVGVAYAVLPYPTAPASCGAPSSPNGNAAGDSLANAASYEQFDSITDPQPGIGWLDSAQFEIGDKCAYMFPASATSLNNGGIFALQTEYSNGVSNCENAATSHFQVAPSSITISTLPGSNPATQTLTITNSGVAPLNWTLTSALPSWLSVTPTSGSLAIGASQAVTLSFSTPSTTAQVYSTTLVFTDPTADNSPFSVPVTVLSTSHFQLAPSAVSLTTPPGVSPAAQTLTITNSASLTLNWTLTSTLPSWLQLSATSGGVAGGSSQQVQLMFSTSSMTPQTYATTLVLADPNADNSPLSIPVTVVSGYSHFQVTPTAFNFTVVPGDSPGPQTLTIANSGVSTLNWSFTSTLPSWLSANPTSGSLSNGSSELVTLTFNTASTTPQIYTTSLTLADIHADNSPVSVPVKVVSAYPPLPKPWSDQDIGSTGQVGGAYYTQGVFTVLGSGADIFNTSDAFHYVYRKLTGDGQIIARVSSMQNTDPYAKAGVMIRSSLDPSAAAVMVELTPANGAYMQWRSAAGGSTTNTSGVTGIATPYWLKLLRQGNAFTGYVSIDGVNWTLLATQSVTMSSSIYIGLAVTSHNTALLNTSAFDQVQVSAPGSFQISPNPLYVTAQAGSTPASQVISIHNAGSATINWQLTSTLPPWMTLSVTSGHVAGQHTQTLTVSFAPTTSGVTFVDTTTVVLSDPKANNLTASIPITLDASPTPVTAPWIESDLGQPEVPGSAAYASSTGTFSLSGSGSDIGATTGDQFHFVYQPLTGDGEIIAHVESVKTTDPGAKVGVMMRETLDPLATYALSAVTAGQGECLLWRSTTGGAAGGAPCISGAAPYWLKLVRAGNTFTGYASQDGVTWQQTGSVSITMATTIYVGLALTSHNVGAFGSAVVDSVNVATAPYADMSVTPRTVQLATAPGTNPAAFPIALANTGAVTLNWSLASALPTWLTLNSTSGTVAPGSSQTVTLTFTTPSSTPQTYATTLVFTDPHSDNSPYLVPVEVLSTYEPITATASAGFSATQGLNQWRYQYSNDGEATFHDMSYDASNTRWQGSEQYCLVGNNWQHPGLACDSVRTWTASMAGTMTLSANGIITVAAACGGNTSGTQIRILKNGAQVWPATGWQVLPNGSTFTFPNGVTASVSVGDQLQFVLAHVGSSINCDATSWDQIISMQVTSQQNPPNSYTASAGFSSTQGQGQWRYQYSTDGENTFQDMSYDSANTRWQGSQGGCLVANNWQHPDLGCDSVRTWIAPSNGAAVLTTNGLVSVIPGCNGNTSGTQIRILKNGAQIWPASGWQVIPNGSSFAFPAGISVSVVTGDHVQFALAHVGSTNACDTTTWDAVATLLAPTLPQSHLQISPGVIALTTLASVNPSPQAITITNTGQGPLNWSLLSTLPQWLSLSATSGVIGAGASQTVTATLATQSASSQTFATVLSFIDQNADNSPIFLPMQVTTWGNGGYPYSASTGYSTTQGQGQWRYQYSTDGENTFQDMSYDSANTRWRGSQGGCLVGSNWQHPDLGCDSSRTWIAPSSGSVTIAVNGVVTVVAGCNGNTSGTQIRILKNGAQLWPTTGWQVIPNGSSFTFPTGVTTTVNAGDQIQFILAHVGSSNACDTTTWDQTELLQIGAPGSGTFTYMGLTGFSGTQGQNQWRYQSSADGEATFQDMTYDATNTRWQGSQPDCFVGGNWQFPGDNCDPVRTWIAPASGSVTLSINGMVSVTTGCNGNTSGVKVRILKNGVQLWPASGWQVILNGSSFAFPAEVTTNVMSGDQVQFVLAHISSTVNCDTTLWDQLVKLTVGRSSAPRGSMSIRPSRTPEALSDALTDPESSRVLPAVTADQSLLPRTSAHSRGMSRAPLGTSVLLWCAATMSSRVFSLAVDHNALINDEGGARAGDA